MFDTLLVGLSLLSGGMLIKATANAFAEIAGNNRRLREIENCPKFERLTNKASLTESKKKGEKRLVYVEVDGRDLKNVTQTTFSRKYNTLNPVLHSGILTERFLPSCCGKDFNFRSKSEMVVVDIRDCSIHRELLQQKQEKVFLQSSINPAAFSPTQYVSYLLSFRAGLGLAMVGTISYDFSSNNWQLLPSFLLRDMGLRLNMSELKDHFQSLNSSNRALIFIYTLLGFCLLGLNSNRITNFFTGVASFFKGLLTRERDIQNIEVARTRGSQKLKCLCGKNMEALLGCGHLSQCVDCHEKDKLCPVCRKLSRTYSRIYM